MTESPEADPIDRSPPIAFFLSADLSLSLKKKAAANVAAHLADIAAADCGRLVLFSGGRFFLIRPIRGAASADLDSFVVAAEQVGLVRISHQYDSCS